MDKGLVILAVVLTLLVTLPHDTRAQGPALTMQQPHKSTVGTTFVFSVKYLCGTIASSTGLPLAAGTYLTAINIHNAGTNSSLIKFSFNGVLKFDLSLAAGSVLSYDCREIVAGSFTPGTFSPSDPFSEGFVAIERESGGQHVTVVAVYTVAP